MGFYRQLWAGGCLSLLAAAPVFAADASPFLPSGGKTVAVVAKADPELEALQLSGISVIGEEKRFNFVDARTHRSFWVPLHGSVDGMTVASFDPAHDAVTVERGANRRTITLRKSVVAPVPAAQPAPAVAHAASAQNVVGVDEIANPRTPAEIKQAETEARMLVSDLLEISMQERARQRALRQAQEKQMRARAAAGDGAARQ